MLKEGEKIDDLATKTSDKLAWNEKPNMDLLMDILNEKGKETESEDDDLDDYL